MIQGGAATEADGRAGLELSEEGVTAAEHERRQMACRRRGEQTFCRPIPSVEHGRHLTGVLEGFAGQSQCVPRVVSFEEVGVGRAL